jgi:hypothetical protein
VVSHGIREGLGYGRVDILGVYWDHVLEITANTVALCTALTEQAGMALENAHVYAEAAARGLPRPDRSAQSPRPARATRRHRGQW